MDYEKVRAISAYTKYPNSPETDKLPQVMHVVVLSTGKELEIMARDPMDALDKANKLCANLNAI